MWGATGAGSAVGKAGVGIAAALPAGLAHAARLLGLRGARCWAWAAAGAGVAHSRLRRVAARAGLGRRGVCAACLAGVVRGAVAGRALRGGRVQSVSQRTRQGVGVGGRLGAVQRRGGPPGGRVFGFKALWALVGRCASGCGSWWRGVAGAGRPGAGAGFRVLRRSDTLNPPAHPASHSARVRMAFELELRV